MEKHAEFDGRKRVVVERVMPSVDRGAWPIKRIVGDQVEVEAIAFADGHDTVAAVLRHRAPGAEAWSEVLMERHVNDRWTASFEVTKTGRHEYTVLAWIDHFTTWAHALGKRVAAGQDVTVDLQIGAAFVETAAARATGIDAIRLTAFAEAFRANEPDVAEAAGSSELARLMARHGERPYVTEFAPALEVVVDRERARFGSWYELFPRSAATEAGRHGTFADVEARLADVERMGFDVLYLPPIHPIGRTFRKGPNNTTTAVEGDPGSPWAIGAAEGGHKAIHPELGTLEEFRHLVAAAAERGIEIAMDIAFQCAPDHPYVTEHPEWFKARPDGTIQYAENPPKKYQDIYPFDFETPAWESLWAELKSVIDFWIEQGIAIFRVDNPHTKPFPFWEWLIGEVKAEHPEVLFLAEAFTRPNILYRLAKIGFTQSYNYFPWRNTREELEAFFTEVANPPVSDFFGPNLWPNTPDILPEYLQYSGRPGFATRFLLAATLGPSYGIFGPEYEFGVDAPFAPGREEYLDSAKYEIRPWAVDRTGSLEPLIATVNRIRRENAAFRGNHRLRFHPTGNDQLLAFTKESVDGTNQVLVVINLDPTYLQSGFVELPLEDLGLDAHQPYQVHDLLTGARYLWHGPRNYVELRPHVQQANIFVLRRKVRTEHDFDYYL